MHLAEDSSRRHFDPLSESFIATGVSVVRGEEAGNSASGGGVPEELEGTLYHFAYHMDEIPFIRWHLELPGKNVIEESFHEFDLSGPTTIDGRRADSGSSRHRGNGGCLEAVLDQGLTDRGAYDGIDRRIAGTPASSTG